MKSILIPIAYGFITFILGVISLGIFVAFSTHLFPEVFRAYMPLIFFVPSLMAAGRMAFIKTMSAYASRKYFMTAITGFLCATSTSLIPGYDTYIWWLPIAIGLAGSMLAIIGASIGEFKSYVF